MNWSKALKVSRLTFPSSHLPPCLSLTLPSLSPHRCSFYFRKHLLHVPHLRRSNSSYLPQARLLVDSRHDSQRPIEEGLPHEVTSLGSVWIDQVWVVEPVSGWESWGFEVSLFRSLGKRRRPADRPSRLDALFLFSPDKTEESSSSGLEKLARLLIGCRIVRIIRICLSEWSFFRLSFKDPVASSTDSSLSLHLDADSSPLLEYPHRHRTLLPSFDCNPSDSLTFLGSLTRVDTRPSTSRSDRSVSYTLARLPSASWI